jgi:hypothetical protein
VVARGYPGAEAHHPKNVAVVERGADLARRRVRVAVVVDGEAFARPNYGDVCARPALDERRTVRLMGSLPSIMCGRSFAGRRHDCNGAITHLWRRHSRRPRKRSCDSMMCSSNCARSNPARALLTLLVWSLSIRRSAASTRSRAPSKSGKCIVEIAAACVSHVVPSTPSLRGWLTWAASWPSGSRQ